MRGFIVIALGALACNGDDALAPLLSPPQNFYYVLDVSGNPDEPAGVLWRWDPVQSADLDLYHVYSRPSGSDTYGLRVATTSTTFHDRGIPDLDYFVVAVDVNGVESAQSDVVTVDERLRLESADWIAGTSLDGAIHLAWDDTPFQSEPAGFSKYHVYSAPTSLDIPAAERCVSDWAREGTTVAPEFLAWAANGQPRCFAVAAESIEGWESFWSPLWIDTPRPDARNVIVWAHEVDPTQSGFRFFNDANGDGQLDASELGIVTAGGGTDVDFRLDRDGAGDFFFAPVRTGTQVVLYGTDPVADLTSIDIAPDVDAGYDVTPIQAVPQFGYVFQMSAGDEFARYGAIRVTHVGQEYIIFDWSYQTDPGNPELSVGAGVFVAGGEGIVVKR
jgi:hypothetical protein